MARPVEVSGAGELVDDEGTRLDYATGTEVSDVAAQVTNLRSATSNRSVLVDEDTAGQVAWWGRPLMLPPAAGYTTATKTSLVLGPAPELAASTLRASDVVSGKIYYLVSNTSGANRTWATGFAIDAADVFTVTTGNIATGTSNMPILVEFEISLGAFITGWARLTVDGVASDLVVVLAAAVTYANALTIDAHTTVSGVTVATTPALASVRFERP